MLERVWRKGSPLTLLVRMSIGTATMENRIEVSKKKKQNSGHKILQPHSSAYPEKANWKRHMHPNVPFTTPRHGNNLNVYRRMNKED